MQCAKCDGELKRVAINGVEVDQCDKCSGIWFDIGELKKVLEAGEIDALKNKIDNNEGQDSERVPCPRCGGVGRMIPVVDLNHTDVRIDTCSVCYGQWLDGGELEKLSEPGIVDKIKKLFGKLASQVDTI